MLTELWSAAHYRDAHIQVSDWTDYDPSFWLMNGRAYPDTLAPNGDPTSSAAGRLQYQPISSLVTCNAGERVLLRMSNLGYQSHTMTADNIDMTVVAKDGSLLRGRDGTTNYLTTTSVDIGPGESRDVIFQAPAAGRVPALRPPLQLPQQRWRWRVRRHHDADPRRCPRAPTPPRPARTREPGSRDDIDQHPQAAAVRPLGHRGRRRGSGRRHRPAQRAGTGPGAPSTTAWSATPRPPAPSPSRPRATTSSPPTATASTCGPTPTRSAGTSSSPARRSA